MRAQCSIPPYLCAAIGLLGACTTSPTGPADTKLPDIPPGATLFLVVAPSAATIKGGHTLLLTVSRQDAHGQTIAPAEVVWVSSNIKVARIGSDGTVVGAGVGPYRSRLSGTECGAPRRSPCSATSHTSGHAPIWLSPRWGRPLRCRPSAELHENRCNPCSGGADKDADGHEAFALP